MDRALNQLVECGPTQDRAPKRVSMTEGLESRKARLQDQLAEIDAALAALKANPEVEKVLNLVSKAAQY